MLEAVVQNRFVIARDHPQLRIFAHAQQIALPQMNQRQLVLSQPEFAQPQHRQRGAELPVNRDEFEKGLAGVGVTVAFVKDRAGAPPSLLPHRFQSQRPEVERRRLIGAIGFARFVGALGELIEIGPRAFPRRGSVG